MVAVLVAREAIGAAVKVMEAAARARGMSMASAIIAATSTTIITVTAMSALLVAMVALPLIMADTRIAAVLMAREATPTAITTRGAAEKGQRHPDRSNMSAHGGRISDLTFRHMAL